MKKIVLKLDLHDGKQKQKALKTVSALSGIDSIAMDMKEKKLTVIGVMDPITTVSKLRKYWPTTDIISVGPAKEPEKPAEKKEEGAKAEDGKKEEGKKEGGEGKKEEGKKEGGDEAKKEGGDDKKKDEKKAAPVVVPYDHAMLEMMKARAYNPQMLAYNNPHMLAYNNPHMTYYNPHHLMTPYNPPMTSYNAPMNTYYAQSHEENPNGTCTVRVKGVNIIPHFGRIEDKELEFYSDFSIIVLGLDSVEARSYINAVACSFLEYDSQDCPLEETMKPMVDGGTEGFKGHARVIIPGVTPCFECTIWLFPPQVKFPLCTLAETPRTAAHCIEYAHLIKWDEVHSGKAFDPDNPEHMQWAYSEAVKRAELFGIPGVTYPLTQGVIKNIIPAIASTNAIISATCTLETLKIASGCSKTLSNYLTYNGVEGLHVKVTEFVKDTDCLACGPGVLVELDPTITLKKFIELLEEHPKLHMSKASVTYKGTNLYMQAPPVLEEMTRSNLTQPLFELMNKTPMDAIHVTGKKDKKTSSVRKLRISFKGVDGVSDMDTAATGV